MRRARARSVTRALRLSRAHGAARRLGKPDVAEAFDNRAEYAKGGSRETRVAALQQAATDLLQSLFAQSHARIAQRADEPAELAAGAPLERAATDAARAVDPSQFSDEAHFPTLSEEAAAAAALQRQWGAAGGPSAAVVNARALGAAGRINLASADQFPTLGGPGDVGPAEGGAGVGGRWAAGGARAALAPPPPPSSAGRSAAAALGGGAAAKPPGADDFPTLGGGGARGGPAPALNGCSSRAPWVDAAASRPASRSADGAAGLPPSMLFSRKAGAPPPPPADLLPSAAADAPPAPPKPAPKPQAPPRPDEFPDLSAAAAGRAAAAAAKGAKPGAKPGGALGAIGARNRAVIGLLKEILAAREPPAAGKRAPTVVDAQRLCRGMQAGSISEGAFLTRFEELLGSREAALALLPEVAALLPDGRKREELARCYAAAYPSELV